jgi:hypothetical protein
MTDDQRMRKIARREARRQARREQEEDESTPMQWSAPAPAVTLLLVIIGTATGIALGSIYNQNKRLNALEARTASLPVVVTAR